MPKVTTVATVVAKIMTILFASERAEKLLFESKEELKGLKYGRNDEILFKISTQNSSSFGLYNNLFNSV